MSETHTGRIALGARFAGLGIAALTSFALVTAPPALALAEEADPADDGHVLAIDEVADEGAQQEPAGEAAATEEDDASLPGSPDAETSVDGTVDDGTVNGDAGDGAPVVPDVTAEDAAQASAADQVAALDDSESAPVAQVDEPAAEEPGQDAAQADAEPTDDVTPDSSPLKAPAETSTETDPTPTPPAPVVEKKNGWQTVDGKTFFYVDDVVQKGWRTSDVDPLTGKKGTARTYWLDANGVLAVGRVIAPSVKRDAAAGMYAYASDDGSIVMGRSIEVDGRIYIANKKGKLLSLSKGKKKGFRWATSWGSSSTKERYYLYRDNKGSDKGVYYAVKGYSKDYYGHYTRTEGFVVRGIYKTGTKRGSRIYLATENGKLASLDGAKKGWTTSSSWGAKNKRYYLQRDKSGAYYARLGYSTSGYAHYTTSKGYVKTKTWTDKSGHIYIANKKGKLATLKKGKLSGWLSSSEFVKGNKRYYLYKDSSDGTTKGAYFAIKGYTEIGTPHYTNPNGTALTGILKVDDKVYVANKKGKMLTLPTGVTEGYTSVVDYGQGKQRYYLYKETTGDMKGAYFARVGFAINKGSKAQGHLTLKAGYVLRGARRSGKKVYIASEAGVLLTLTSGKAEGITGEIDFGQGKQRYYLYKETSGRNAGAYYAMVGFSTDGPIDHYTTKSGYLLRNKCQKYQGLWYYADKNGEFKKLTSGKIGWQNPSQYYQVSAYNVSNLPAGANGFFTYITSSRIAPDATREQCVETFVSRAMEYLGTEYKWDWAMAPGQGVDCAGLVMQCLYAVGMKTPYDTYSHMYDPWQDHNAENMRADTKFKQISFSERKRGDLIFYKGHVGIYLGNDRIINAYPPQVQIQSVYSWNVTGCSRVFV